MRTGRYYVGEALLARLRTLPRPLVPFGSLRNLRLGISVGFRDLLGSFRNLRVLEIDTHRFRSKEALIPTRLRPQNKRSETLETISLDILARSCPLLECLTVTLIGDSLTYTEQGEFDRLKTLRLHTYGFLPKRHTFSLLARRLRLVHQDMREPLLPTDDLNQCVEFWQDIVRNCPRISTIHTDCNIDTTFCWRWWEVVADLPELTVVHFIRRVRVQNPIPAEPPQDSCPFFLRPQSVLDGHVTEDGWLRDLFRVIGRCRRLRSVAVWPPNVDVETPSPVQRVRNWLQGTGNTLNTRIVLRELPHESVGPAAEAHVPEVVRCCHPYTKRIDLTNHPEGSVVH